MFHESREGKGPWMSITRRVFLKGAAVGLAGATAASKWAAAEAADTALRIHIGSCHIGLAGAKEAGLDGVEVGVGNAADTLSIAEPATRQKYKNEMTETGLVVCSFMMGLLNSYPLASDPRGPAWLEQSIDAAKDLGAKVILVAFFGKGSLGTRGNVKAADVDVVVQRIKAAAPRARDAGVVLGIENELPAKANLEILDRIGSDAVGIYYDVYNLTNNGYDIPAEIRLLKDRICRFHFKNGPDYLESGKVKWEPVAAAMKESGYRKWIVLETSNPSKNVVADDRKNAEYIRKLFA
jgi:L-ribulose-5-phosphate 3-epimerase